MVEQGQICQEDDRMIVPDRPIILFIEGDGIGPDIWQASQMVIDAAVSCAYSAERRIQWREVLAGEKAHRQTGAWLPEETVTAIRQYRVAIKGPLTTPVGKGIRSVNVGLRQILDLYACVRPVTYIPGVPSPMRQPRNVDMVVFRENTEDVYMGVEFASGSQQARSVIDLLANLSGKTIRPDAAIGIKPISPFGTRRLVNMAIQYALDHERSSVTLVHKGNIMKYTEGGFRNWGYETAVDTFGDRVITEEDLWEKYDGTAPEGRIVIKDRIADAMFQSILLRPEEYSVLAMPNLNGDYMSDALAAMVGGLGMAPGANIGHGCAVFEATHGTAPKYAGQDKVNPGSLILSGAMMLDYLGWNEAAGKIRRGLAAAVASRRVTYDLARQMDGATLVACSEFGRIIADHMERI